MCTGRCSGHLSCHTYPLPCMPPTTHAPCHECPHHTYPLSWMPPALHAPPPCTPPAMHAPLPCTHPLPCTPPCYACPLAMHTPPCHAVPPLPCMPPLPHTPPPILWTEYLTHVCENITFPQLLLRTVINTVVLPESYKLSLIKSNVKHGNFPMLRLGFDWRCIFYVHVSTYVIIA